MAKKGEEASENFLRASTVALRLYSFSRSRILVLCISVKLIAHKLASLHALTTSTMCYINNHVPPQPAFGVLGLFWVSTAVLWRVGRFRKIFLPEKYF